jgi:hypothetical protein
MPAAGIGRYVTLSSVEETTPGTPLAILPNTADPVTVTNATNEVSAAGDWPDNSPLLLGGTTAPAPLVLGRTYYWLRLTASTGNLRGYDGGPALDVTSDGTGVTLTPQDTMLAVDGDVFSVSPQLETEDVQRVVGKGSENPQIIDKIYTAQGGVPVLVNEKTVPTLFRYALKRVTATGDAESRTINHFANLGASSLIQFGGSKVRSVTISASADAPALRLALDGQAVDHSVGVAGYSSAALDAMRPPAKAYSFLSGFVILPNVRSVNPADWGSIATLDVTGFSLQLANNVTAIGQVLKVLAGDEALPRKWRRLVSALLAGGQALTGSVQIAPTDLSQFNFMRARTQAMLFLYFIDPTVNGIAVTAGSLQAATTVRAKLAFTAASAYEPGDTLFIANPTTLVTPPVKGEVVRVDVRDDGGSPKLVEVTGRARISGVTQPGFLYGAPASGHITFLGALELFVPGIVATAHGFRGGATEGVTEELTIKGDAFTDHLSNNYDAIHWAAKGTYK